MFPIDDPTWPVCVVLNCEGRDTGWCSHIRHTLIENEDAADLTPGNHYCVPVYPDFRMFARVSLSADVLNSDPVMCKLALVRSDPNDIAGIVDDEFIELGIHTAGEGRRYIAEIIHSWKDVTYEPTQQCTWHQHGLAEENQIQKVKDLGHNLGQKGFNWRSANSWCIIYKGKCLPCFEKSIATVAPDFTASSFGLDDSVTEPQQSSTMSALQSRFGR